MRADNLLAVRNEAREGGALFAFATGLILNHATIADNHARVDGSALFGGNRHQLTNSIIWGNTTPGNALPSTGITTNVHNLIEGSAGARDPRFVDSAYELAFDSPAIDAPTD